MLAKNGKTGSVLHCCGERKSSNIFAGQISNLTKLQCVVSKMYGLYYPKKTIFRQKWLKAEETYQWSLEGQSRDARNKPGGPKPQSAL